MNNCLSGTMSLGANLLSIFVPSYFLTVTSTIVDEHIESILDSRRQNYIKLTKKATNKLKNFCFC